MITDLDRVCFSMVAPDIRAEFDLSKSEVGLLFSAFALAYAVFEVPTAWLGDIFGARRTLIRIVLWWSAFTALTGLIYPLSFGVWAFSALVAVRFLFGVGEAGAFPNISRAFADWFPSGERGFAQGTVWMAGRFGGGITPFVVLLMVYTTAGADGVAVKHWRHVFWILGAVGTVWCVAFWVWFRDRPEEHSAVNDAERLLITGSAVTAQPGHGGVPWAKILSDGNLRLLCLMYFCAAYGWYFNITWLPDYLGETYGVTKDEYGIWAFSLLAGAPLLAGSLACLIGGLLTDAFIRRTGDRKWGRRLFGICGHGACAVCYFLSLTARSPWVFVFYVALAAFFNDLTMGSAWASCIDIGGKYAGIVSGCMNTIGNLGGAVAGYASGKVVEYFTKTHSLERGWTINIISFGAVYLIAVLLWLRFDATKQVAQE
jgi:MFS family permease